MAEKSLDDQIADLEKKIKELQDKKYELEHPVQEYPKYLPETRTVVANKDEESKALAAVSKDERVAPISADEKLQADRVRAQDAEETKYKVSQAKADAKHVPGKR